MKRVSPLRISDLLAQAKQLGMAQTELMSVLHELRERRGGRNRPGLLVMTMANMAIDDVRLVDPVDHSRLSKARRSARRIMQEDDAAWTATTRPDGLCEIRRIANGAPPPRRPQTGPQISLAAMAVGDVHEMSADRLHHALKVRARGLMKQPSADWRAARRDGVLHVTRIR